MRRGILSIVFLFFFTSGLWADEVKNWDNNAAFGMTLTNGNSNTFSGNITVTSERKKPSNEIRLGVEANYGETEVEGTGGEKITDTNVQNARGWGDYKWLLDERNYIYVNGVLSQDEIADIDYRIYVGPGVGRYIIKNDNSSLSVEGGVSYIKEKLGGLEDERAVLRLYERCEHRLSATSKIWQYLEYLPAFEDFSNYLLNGEIGIEAAINSHMNLRLVAQDKYNSMPAVGKEKNDFTLIAGIGIKF